MSNDLRKRLIALGAIAVVGIALFVLVRLDVFGGGEDEPEFGEPFAESEDRPEPIFGESEFSQVTRFTIQEWETGLIFRAERDENGLWTIQEAPRGFDTGLGVDSERIQSAVTTLPTTRPNSVLSEFEALATYGLAEPDYTLWVTMDDGQEYRLAIGDKNPSGSAYYTILSGQERKIMMTPTYALEAVIGFLVDPPYLQAPTPEGEGGDS